MGVDVHRCVSTLLKRIVVTCVCHMPWRTSKHLYPCTLQTHVRMHALIHAGGSDDCELQGHELGQGQAGARSIERPTRLQGRSRYIVMAYIVMAYIVMACVERSTRLQGSITVRLKCWHNQDAFGVDSGLTRLQRRCQSICARHMRFLRAGKLDFVGSDSVLTNTEENSAKAPAPRSPTSTHTSPRTCTHALFDALFAGSRTHVCVHA